MAAKLLRVALGLACAVGLAAEPSGRRAEPARLRAHVEMLARQLAPRTADEPEDLEPAAAYIRGQLRGLGLEVRDQAVEFRGERYANLVSELGPDTPERIVVGAHYDAQFPGPGADDNASGVAGLLELAALLHATPPPLRVELVAYTLEEDGLAGSQVHARALRDGGAKLRAMFSLEMVGYFSDAPGSQRHASPELAGRYPDTGNFIVVVGRESEAELVRRIEAAMRPAAAPLVVASIAAPLSLRGVSWSDHASYWRAGFPAVMVTDTAFLRNPNYHEATDTPETLDYARMARVVDGVYAAVQDLASR